MANICGNKFYIYAPSEIVDSICCKLKTVMGDKFYWLDISYCCGEIIEGYFDSNWAFPTDIFENFFDEFDNEEIYMRCLSEEYGCDYVAMNIYSDKHWWDEQTFNL
jgi:hypothetical protein